MAHLGVCPDCLRLETEHNFTLSRSPVEVSKIRLLFRRTVVSQPSAGVWSFDIVVGAGEERQLLVEPLTRAQGR